MFRRIPLLLMLAAHASAFPEDMLRKPDAWFSSEEGRKTTACVLSWQSDLGSWPKNGDSTRKPYEGNKSKLKGTFDNKATTDELRYLAKAFNATRDPLCEKAFLLGYDHILKAQYANGGWPQYYPLSKQYHRHITFNDNSMVRLLEFFRETFTDKSYDFIGAERKAAGEKSFARGIDCIVKCQVVKDGKPTVWCAQHDEVTLAPAKARAYELESLSGSESAGILRFLMSLDKPSPEVIRAVKGGVEWFEKSKIPDIKVEKIDGVRTVVSSPGAEPMWGRFYDLETNKPFFCDRDGIKKWNYNEIGRERRNGYAWFGTWGEPVIREFRKWPHR